MSLEKGAGRRSRGESRFPRSAARSRPFFLHRLNAVYRTGEPVQRIVASFFPPHSNLCDFHAELSFAPVVSLAPSRLLIPPRVVLSESAPR